MIRIGDLVIARPEAVDVDFDYGVGIIIKIINKNLCKDGVSAYVVKWSHAHQWWHEDELTVLASLDELT